MFAAALGACVVAAAVVATGKLIRRSLGESGMPVAPVPSVSVLILVRRVVLIAWHCVFGADAVLLRCWRRHLFLGIQARIEAKSEFMMGYEMKSFAWVADDAPGTARFMLYCSPWRRQGNYARRGGLHRNRQHWDNGHLAR